MKSDCILSQIVVMLSQLQSRDLLHFVNCFFFVSESYLLSESGGVFSIPDKSPISWFIPWACLTRNIFCGAIPLADTIFNGIRVCEHKQYQICISYICLTSCNMYVHFKQLTLLSGFMGCAKWKQCLSKCVPFSIIQSDSGPVTYNCSHYITLNDQWIVNCKRCGRKQLWHNLRLRPEIMWLEVYTVLLISCWLVISYWYFRGPCSLHGLGTPKSWRQQTPPEDWLPVASQHNIISQMSYCSLLGSTASTEKPLLSGLRLTMPLTGMQFLSTFSVRAEMWADSRSYIDTRKENGKWINESAWF
jgi:hypothetical protein